MLHAGEALRMAAGPGAGVDEFNSLLEPFRMPVLMFLSGVLLPRSLAKPASEYFAGKLSRVAWPYVLWSLIVLAATGGLSPDGIARIVLLAPTYLWYLWFLLVFYTLAYPLSRVPVPPLAVAAISLTVSLVLPDGSRAETMAFLAAFFFLGAWCFQHLRRMELTLAEPWVVVPASALAVLVGVLNLLGQDVLYRAEYGWGVLGGLVVACWAFPRLGGNRLTAALEFVGRYSIVFYVAHLGPIMITLTLARTAGFAGEWFMLPLLLLVGVGAPLGLAWMYSTRKHASVNLLFELPVVKRRPEGRTARFSRSGARAPVQRRSGRGG